MNAGNSLILLILLFLPQKRNLLSGIMQQRRVDARSSRMPTLGNHRPVSPEPIPMSPGYCIRVDDEQATRPRGPRASECDPESSIVVVEVWAGALFLQRRHLLPQSEVFDHKVGSAPTHRSQRTGAERDEENEYTEHSGEVSPS